MKKTKQRFIIEDWAGNVLDFKGLFKLPQLAVAMEFDDFESGWEYIYEKFPGDTDDGAFDDFYVMERN